MPDLDSPIKAVLSFFPKGRLLDLANSDYMLGIKDAKKFQEPGVIEEFSDNIKARSRPLKTHLSNLNKPVLKEICKELELKRSGRKTELLARITGAIDEYIEATGKPKKEEVGIVEEYPPLQKTKLELTWPKKNKMLIYEYGEDCEPIPKFRERGELEPRILVDVEQVGTEEEQEYNPKQSNLLIKGDNLFALKALERDFAGEVKLIYIDPPFNTGSALEHYDDGLEHSIWLNIMRDRLTRLEKLLDSDGLIFVHIDDREMAYLKVLMDEVFGRNNFLTTITVKDSHPSGLKTAHSDKTIVKIKSYLLLIL